ncbi:hypothetical protein M9H77_19298 [Catharanthus roseus]|uniref:Uncharacterized protein n=1 Tax=Catharanthus roseus TaxID=4058 RepID=A0ACC0B9Z4_CATRO|nr:hypothetical protein M9H77_19298 [Catharanthus roseus]
MTDCKEEKFLKKELHMEDLNEKKVYCLTKIQRLKERINAGSANSRVERLVSLLRLSKDLERQESDVLSHCIIEYAKLHAEVNEVEVMLQDTTAEQCQYNIPEKSLHESRDRLNLLKMELASKLRLILSVKRQIDDVPVPAELIQYELRFSELYTNIQRKLRQTRKLYDTYNALLEIKELMLKETSLLGSISSQFQDAIATPAGRNKLIDSMEGILQGIQQKLEKIQLSQESEEKVCEAMKAKYRKSLAEQRRCYSLLKTFQEECARNERLRGQHSNVLP